MEEYKPLELEIIEFDCEDIITQSGEGDPVGGNGGGSSTGL